MENSPSRRTFLKDLLTIIVVGLLYFLTGFAGLTYLSTPPGYATPIWIPSGIALGAALIWGLRIVPGIFVASAFLNVFISTRLDFIVHLYTPLLVGIIIGIGATLQTIAGWFMIKKWIGLQNKLNSPNDILLFALLSGPVSCLVNTTWSNTCLLLLKIVTPSNFLFAWGTWWIGDSTGVLIFTPLFLILFAKPHSIWRQRIVPILIPLCLSFVAVIFFYHLASTIGLKEQLWLVLISGLLFCVLINIILFIVNGQKNIAQIRMKRQAKIMKTAMLERMAHYDALTGLPNRASFLEKLTSALEDAKINQRVIAVCFIDIDNFKQINDTLGHIVGDEILKNIPKLLEPELTKKGFLARFGGDEFAVIIENVISIDYIKLTLQRFIKILQQPLKIDHHEILVSLSMGVATYPMGGDSAAALIKNADSAMYKAKELGKNTFAFFDEEISQRVQRLKNIEIEMPKAIRRGEFAIYYQPLIDSKTIQLLGFEILLRWNSPILNEVSPNEFISIAEKNGLIHEIGEWVLKKACVDYKKITHIFNDKNLLLSINISVLQLENEQFLSKIKNILCDTEMNSNNLIFEITETELMQQPERTIELIKEIKKLGIRFALDDFGVSYSSLQYLKILPVSLLKIDQVFIRDIAIDANDAAIVRAIIQLAHGLGISTIAEGVETQDQFSLLKEMGCEYIQGFYFLEPMPIEELGDKYQAPKGL